jgi:hypothetical protein
VARGVVPFGTADGTEEHRIGALAALQRLGGQCLSGGVDRGTADQQLLEREFMSPLARDRTEHADALGDHFGADAVARHQRNARLHD